MGRGLATRVCERLTQWAHRDPELARVQATVLVSNARSMRVLERCAFVREGVLRRYRWVRGRPGDFVLYAHVEG